MMREQIFHLELCFLSPNISVEEFSELDVNVEHFGERFWPRKQVFHLIYAGADPLFSISNL